MPNEHGEYTDAEADDYESPCPRCGQQRSVQWVTSNPGKEPPLHVPGKETCTNEGCPESPDYEGS